MQPDLDAWAERAARDTALAAACRGLDRVLTLRAGGAAVALRLADPPTRIAAREGDIVIEGAEQAFRQMMQALPPPGLHSFGAIIRHDAGISVTADPLVQAQALAALERLVELARPAGGDPGTFGFPHDASAVRGFRRSLASASCGGALVHWLEAGDGTPLVFLHTAGADSRQFLHQLADGGLRSRFRMMAFDLPWHGLSSGVDGDETAAGYVLTEASYIDWCAAFIEVVAGAPALVVGCSMGAAMALTLAARRPDLLRGFVALESPMEAPGRRSDLLADARISNGLHNPAYVRAMLGPASPQRRRDEACAIYAQARPGIYMGDLAYYSDEYAGSRIAAGVRAAGLRGSLLTGAYDYSASPANTRRLHAAIGSDAVRFEEMPGLGHFPMIEHPEAFRPFLMRALAWAEEGR